MHKSVQVTVATDFASRFQPLKCFTCFQQFNSALYYGFPVKVFFEPSDEVSEGFLPAIVNMV